MDVAALVRAHGCSADCCWYMFATDRGNAMQFYLEMRAWAFWRHAVLVNLFVPEAYQEHEHERHAAFVRLVYGF